MKITLVQLDASLDWRGLDLIQCLRSAPRADLTVFPECYPFWREAGISHTTAMQRLEGMAGQLPGKTFMAGGYVADVGVDGVGKVDGGGAVGQHQNYAFWGEDIYFIGE